MTSGFSLLLSWECTMKCRRKQKKADWWSMAVCWIALLIDPPRHDSVEAIRKALNLGVNVKMITDDQFAIAKETGRRLGMGTNMYPSSTLLGSYKDASITAPY